MTVMDGVKIGFGMFVVLPLILFVIFLLVMGSWKLSLFIAVVGGILYMIYKYALK